MLTREVLWQTDRPWQCGGWTASCDQEHAQGARRARLRGAAAARAWCGKPECSTELRAISHRSVALSFQTCAATLYSSTSGSLVRWICAGPTAPPQLLHAWHFIHAEQHHACTG
jgi:hypothetical protein